jgi:hypothetical protein
MRDAEVISRARDGGVGDRQEPGQEQGALPAPGAAACPLPSTGSPPVAGAAARSAAPHPQAGGSRPDDPQ